MIHYCTIKQSFIRELRNYRATTGLTQEQLARALDISTSYLTQIEGGHKEPSAKILKKFLSILERQKGETEQDI